MSTATHEARPEPFPQTIAALCLRGGVKPQQIYETGCQFLVPAAGRTYTVHYACVGQFVALNNLPVPLEWLPSVLPSILDLLGEVNQRIAPDRWESQQIAGQNFVFFMMRRPSPLEDLTPQALAHGLVDVANAAGSFDNLLAELLASWKKQSGG